jgi:hypothetical protein
MIFTDDQKLDNFLYVLLTGLIIPKELDRIKWKECISNCDPWKDMHCVNFLLTKFKIKEDILR